MWVVNQRKMNERIHIKNELSGSIARLTDVKGQLDQLVSRSDFVLAGAQSKATNDTRRASEIVDKAEGLVRQAKQCTDRFEVREWVDDE